MQAALGFRAEPVAPVHQSPEIETLLGVGIAQDSAAGQTIVVEGEPRSHGFRVLSGAVRLVKGLADGRRQVIEFLVAGEYFGLVGAAQHAYSVEAIVASKLARYPCAKLDAAVRANPVLAGRLLELARTDLERAHAQMLLLGRKTAEEKIASFLLALARRQGDGASPVRILKLPLSRQDMADYLGLTIETVSRTMTRLRHDGLIALPSPQQVILQQFSTLEALAEGAG
jgi:CRP/FNR family transcriptional regulator, anaerobic regulatory protein